VNLSAHRRHLSAIRFHVALLSVSRVNFAICSHWAACFKNSSGGFIGLSSTTSSSGTARPLESRSKLCKKCNLRDFVPALPPIRPRETRYPCRHSAAGTWIPLEAVRNAGSQASLLGQGAATSGNRLQNLAAGPEQNRRCRILTQDVKTEGRFPPEVEMRRPTRAPIDRMKFPLTLAGGLRTTFANVASIPPPERLVALMRCLNSDRDEPSEGEPGHGASTRETPNRIDRRGRR
jgi:hypothetical protein